MQISSGLKVNEIDFKSYIVLGAVKYKNLPYGYSSIGFGCASEHFGK